MKKMLKILSSIEVWVIVGLSVTMVFCISVQIFNRLVTKLPITWTEELARYCMVYVIMLGTEVGLRKGSIMAVSLFTDWLPKVFKNMVEIFAHIVNIFFCSVTAYASLLLISVNIRVGQISPNMHLPMYIPYLSVTIALSVMAITQIVSLIASICLFVKTKGQEIRIITVEESASDNLLERGV